MTAQPPFGFIDLPPSAQPRGFGEALGNDVSLLQKAVKPCMAVLEAAREANILVIHTREGHRPDLTDLHSIKLRRPGAPGGSAVIGSFGPGGKVLVRGSPGHDIIPQLYPCEGEPVIDKPGKGSFYSTDLECILRASGIVTLLVCGVTTEVCVHTTIREANDRGFFCVMLEDCCASYNEEFHRVAVQMVSAQGGIFGSVTNSSAFIQALKEMVPS
jgi:biuret amidohydrolase